MAKLVWLDDLRRRRSFVHFTRPELNQLLQLYSRRVASGEWRDYAIDHDTLRARFMVFRNRLAGPTFTIVKLAPSGDGKSAFLVASGMRSLKRGASLPEVLAIFERKLTLVSSGI
jgi:uncharacterized protein DUF2794